MSFLHRVVAARVAGERAKFVSGFARWVKGQAQGLEPGAFKLWVKWIQLGQPHRGAGAPGRAAPGAACGPRARGATGTARRRCGSRASPRSSSGPSPSARVGTFRVIQSRTRVMGWHFSPRYFCSCQKVLVASEDKAQIGTSDCSVTRTSGVRIWRHVLPTDATTGRHVYTLATRTQHQLMTAGIWST